MNSLDHISDNFNRNDKELIIYAGDFRFPLEGPSAARVYGIGQSLRDAGYEVLFLSARRQERPEDRRDDGSYWFDGFQYIISNEYLTLRKPISLLCGLFTAGKKTVKWLKEQKLSIKAVIVETSYPSYVHRLHKLCKEIEVPLIADVLEWFEPSHCLGGRFALFRINNEILMRSTLPKTENIIAISSYLSEYYSKRGCRTIRIPPSLDIKKIAWNTSRPINQDGMLKLAYAGAPGKKDVIYNALIAIKQLAREGYPVVLELVGRMYSFGSPKSNLYRRLIQSAGENVVCHGQVPQSKAIELVSDADFTILLRENKRYANAGFSTKLVESLSAGVPVIANPTSDIGEYIHDGIEGILLENHSPDAFASGVRRIFELPRSKWHEMRTHARRCAEDFFDYRHYISPLRDFIEQACERKEK